MLAARSKIRLQDNMNFSDNILFTNDSTFTNHGGLNRYKVHYWSTENPHWLRTVELQLPWSVNMWCGLLKDEIIGPFFINVTLR